MKIRNLALLATLALLLAGCRNAERIAEQRVNALLPEVLGPADRYSSRIRGSLGGLTKGRMESIHAQGVNVNLSEGLVVDHLDLVLTRVSVDTKEQKLRSVESVSFTATMGEEKLNRYVRVQRSDIPGLKIALNDGDATVRARPQVYGMSGVTVTVSGTVDPAKGGRVLNFAPSKARVAVVPVPGRVLNYLVGQLNPVVDLSTMRIPINVRQAQIRKGSLVLTGDVNPADLMRVAAQSESRKQ